MPHLLPRWNEVDSCCTHSKCIRGDLDSTFVLGLSLFCWIFALLGVALVWGFFYPLFS